jgi:cytochrome c oxidase subunit II
MCTRLRSSVSTAALVTLVAGAAAGCGGNGQSALSPGGKDAKDITSLWWIMFIAAAVIFAVVLTLLLVAVLRRRGSQTEAGRGWAGTWLPVVGGIAVPTLVLAALFALTLGTLSSTSPAQAGAAALTIHVTGRQWFWDVSYPSAHVRTANEIHLPVGEPVQVDLSSGDVIHSFWVPELNRKVDMIPGKTNTVTLEATHPGTFRGQCAEFCGLQHANMAFVVVAEEPERFHAWLQEQSMPARPPPTRALKSGQEVFLGSGCVYCHTIAGTNASGKVGPDLTHLASRSFIGAGVAPNSPGELAGWILDPQHLKPGNRMPGTDLSGPELQDLLDYLESLR